MVSPGIWELHQILHSWQAWPGLRHRGWREDSRGADLWFRTCKNEKVVGGFKHFFTPTWGRFPIWRAYFSNGLKPPTRKGGCVWYIHQKLNGTESQWTESQVSCWLELLDTQVFSGSVQWVVLEISWMVSCTNQKERIERFLCSFQTIQQLQPSSQWWRICFQLVHSIYRSAGFMSCYKKCSEVGMVSSN